MFTLALLSFTLSAATLFVQRLGPDQANAMNALGLFFGAMAAVTAYWTFFASDEFVNRQISWKKFLDGLP